jgi:hypothetical protein
MKVKLLKRRKMKHIAISLAFMTLLSGAAFAQDNNGQRPQGQRPDRTEMIKNRTDETVKKYGLNETQAKQLLELNTKFMSRMGGPRGGARRGGQRGGARQGDNGQRPERRDTTQARRPQGPRGMGGQMGEYQQELKKILTEEQYKAYQADMQERMRQGGRRGRGPRNSN